MITALWLLCRGDAEDAQFAVYALDVLGVDRPDLEQLGPDGRAVLALQERGGDRGTPALVAHLGRGLLEQVAGPGRVLLPAEVAADHDPAAALLRHARQPGDPR